MNIRKENFVIFLMALLMAFQPVVTAGMTVSAQTGSDDAPREKQVKIAIFSDIHYVIDQQRSQKGEEAMHYSALTESRMEQEISTILEVALEQAAGENPDVLLACGDLLSNGEYLGAESLAEKFKEAKTDMEGLQQTGIYVVNGNHDINNSYSSDFTKDEYWNAQRVLPEDFKETFTGLGYGDADSYDQNPSRRSTYTPPAGELAGGLSYVTEIAEGITLIVLDTGIYSDDTDEHYGWAQQTAGRISDELLAWAVKEAQTAKSKGNLVLAMCHHGVIPHYSEAKPEDVDWYMSSFIIADWESRAKALADAGVTATLTGHTHASDIAKYVSPDGNVLYDIETAALCAYPTAWRTLTITIDGTGHDKTYSFSVETHFIDKDFEGKEKQTEAWNTMYEDEEVKTFLVDYEGSMQDYGKEKSRYHKDTLKPMIDYMLRVYLYDFLKANGSVEKYLVKLLGGGETDNLKDVLTPLVPQLPGMVSIDDLTFEFGGYKFTLSTDNGSVSKSAEEDPEIKILISTSIGTEEPDLSELVINLDFIPQYAQDLVSKIDTELREPDWMTNNFGNDNRLLTDIVDALSDAVKPLLIDTPLDEDDRENTTVLNIYNDAMLAWAHGDEGQASPETRAKRKEWNELLKGDNFIVSAKQDILKGVVNLSWYSKISEILKTNFKGDSGGSPVQFEHGESETYGSIYSLIEYMLLPYTDSLSDLLQIVNLAGTDTIASLIPADGFKTVAEMLAALHLAFISDTNITGDSVWDFHTVLFYADATGKPTYSASTIEEDKIPEQFISNLPQIQWFTEPEGGDPVDLTESFENLYRAYAHLPKPEPGPYDPGIPEFFRILEDRLPATGFSAEHVTPLRERPQELSYGNTGLTLQIPGLDVAEPILTLPEENGSFPVEWLGRNIGLLEGSAKPGEGITVLTGHNHLNTAEAGPFLFLGTLSEGDKVMVSNVRDELISFKVYGNYKISTDDFGSIIDYLKENTLVMITCEDESAEGGYINRRVILAEPL